MREDGDASLGEDGLDGGGEKARIASAALTRRTIGGKQQLLQSMDM